MLRPVRFVKLSNSLFANKSPILRNIARAAVLFFKYNVNKKYNYFCSFTSIYKYLYLLINKRMENE